MRWGRIYIIPTESMLTVPPTSLQSAWYARSLQNKYVAPASSAWRVLRWHRACTLEAWLSKSRLALNLHLSAAQTAACSLHAPASLKTRTGDVRRRYGSLRFGYRIRRRPLVERLGCDRGFISATLCFHMNLMTTFRLGYISFWWENMVYSPASNAWFSYQCIEWPNHAIRLFSFQLSLLRRELICQCAW